MWAVVSIATLRAPAGEGYYSLNVGSVRNRRKLAPGTIISDRYQVVCCIGSGGMGTVYEVRHRRLDRQFAAKVLAFDLANDYTSLARFRREAEIVAGLRHPNIVDIVDWEHTDDGTPCIIMEYLHGESLADRIQSAGSLPWSEISAIGRQVASALSMAHHAGIVHRDLKPDNIYLARTETGEEVAKLLDFGVSKIRHGNTLATQDFTLLGTPAYMSPEQADSRSDEIDETTDLWALGAILYEMAGNRPAFQAESVPSLLYKVCHTEPTPITDYRPDAPEAFQEILSRALSRDRSRRIASADDLSAALEAALSGAGRDTQLDGLGRAQSAPMGRAASHSDAEVPTRPSVGHQHTTFSQASGQTQTAHVGNSRRRTGLSVMLAVALLGVGLAVGLLVSGQGSSDSADSGDSAEVRPAATVPAAGATTVGEDGAPTGLAPSGDVVPGTDTAGTSAAGSEDKSGDVDAETDESDGKADAEADEGVSATDGAGADGATSPTKKSKRTKKRKRKRAVKKKPVKKKPVRKRGDPVNPFATQ